MYKRVAEECEADLVVMGTHGRRGIGRLFLGSVAEAFVRRAEMPVLLVPRERDADEIPSNL
ncbi:universal stress protein [Paraburkholderia elongata]|uniref:universal stress protein n=1 Tax=Paraburkholderia elongata TaxID=2675747 RepID=UPI0038B2E13D